MKPVHLALSFAGHLLALAALVLLSSALRAPVQPPPPTIRIAFGTLPELRSSSREAQAELPNDIETPPAEETPKEEATKAKPEERPAPKPEEKAPAAEKTAPTPEAPKPKPTEAVKPVTQPADASAPALPAPDTETEESAEASSPAVPGSDLPAAAEPAAPAEGTGEAEAAPRGASVLARGDAGAGDAYLGLVQSKIGRRWQPSAASTGGRPLLETVVAFRIGARGEVIEPTVFQGSGLSVYDREALRAVMESNPLPPPPARFRGQGLNIQFTFTYRR
ncbi:MAG: TonB family protein [Candidatus Krumholzibacteriia bacterium]|nr:TonB family protein [Candidatus Latescibacterota bacterium]